MSKVGAEGVGGLRGIDHAGLHVRDLEASLGFYRDVLGLDFLPRPDLGFGGAWLRVGTQELHLIEKDAAAANTHRGQHVAFSIDDARAWCARLRAHGVACDGVRLRPDGARQVFVRDPDGHVLELVERGA